MVDTCELGHQKCCVTSKLLLVIEAGAGLGWLNGNVATFYVRGAWLNGDIGYLRDGDFDDFISKLGELSVGHVISRRCQNHSYVGW